MQTTLPLSVLLQICDPLHGMRTVKSVPLFPPVWESTSPPTIQPPSLLPEPPTLDRMNQALGNTDRPYSSLSGKEWVLTDCFTFQFQTPNLLPWVSALLSFRISFSLFLSTSGVNDLRAGRLALQHSRIGESVSLGILQDCWVKQTYRKTIRHNIYTRSVSRGGKTWFRTFENSFLCSKKAKQNIQTCIM